VVLIACNEGLNTRGGPREIGHSVTRAVVWNLAKVMLIKDEPYVAAMLTNPEKYKRDQRRFKVNPARGDRITYRHYNRPEFVLFGRTFKFRWRSRDWQLRIMRRCGFLRGFLPAWHQREREFRDWYQKLVDQADTSSDQEYARWLEILKTPEPVTGFRDVRYPKMEAARAKAERLRTEPFDEHEPPDLQVHVSLTDRIVQTH